MTENCELKVTIMIPTYNQAEFIGAAVNSALLQTYPNLEVIVGDDASTDITPAIVMRINDPRLKYVRNPSNLGRAGNYRNLLNCHATGDYVVNLDGDDYYTDPCFIADAVKLLDGNQDVVMVVAKATTKSWNSEHDSDIPDRESARGMEILRRLPNYDFFIKHMATLYNRSKAVEIGFYRTPVISSDWESLYRLSLRGVVKYFDRSVGVWRIHGMNETSTISSEKHLDNLIIWTSIYEDAIAFGMNPVLAKFISARCIAFSAQMSCIRISMKGNAGLIKFVIDVFKKYNLAALILLLTPKFPIRVLLCLMGYYRKKSLF